MHRAIQVRDGVSVVSLCGGVLDPDGKRVMAENGEGNGDRLEGRFGFGSLVHLRGCSNRLRPSVDPKAA
jgi:hypothetical protein